MGTGLTWLIEKDVFLDGNPERIAAAARALGAACRTVEYVEGEPPRGAPEEGRAIVYGSMGFVRDMVRAARWRPTAWFDERVLACHHYYGHWGQYVLQRDYRLLPLGEVCRLKERLYAEVGDGDRLFIRPDDNLKSFAGSVVERTRFEHWHRQNVRCYDLEPSLLCLVARPQQILGEWRLVIRQRQVLTGSGYVGESRTGSEAAVPDEVLALAARVASGPFEPLPMYVMDLARTAEGLFLMEIGSVNCASLYACDIAKVVEAATQLAGGVS